MSNKSAPKASISSLGDGAWVDGVFDTSSDFESAGAFDYGQANGSTSRPKHVQANSPADAEFGNEPGSHSERGFTIDGSDTID